MKQSIRTLGSIAVVLIALGSQACAAASIEEERAEARQLYEDGRWSLAWDRFASLADRGDADSARMVIRMTRYGGQLFQQAWAPPPEQMARWRAAAAQAVRTAVNEPDLTTPPATR